MGFFIEDNDLLTEPELIEKRKKIIKRKMQLLQQFRNYILDYLRKESEPLDVEYELINGKTDIPFRNIKLGTEFTYEKVYFKFNLQRELTSNYLKNSYGRITKIKDKENNEIIDDVAKGCDIGSIKPRPIRRLQTNLSMVSDFERQKIIERIQLEVDNILKQVFKRELSFDDQEFNKLVKINAYLEKELREIDKLLKPKDNYNGFGQKRR